MDSFPFPPIYLLTILSELKGPPTHLNSSPEPSRIRTETQIQEPLDWWKTLYWRY